MFINLLITNVNIYKHLILINSMTIIRVDDGLHKEVSDMIKEGDKVEYPSIKNFIDRAIKEKLVREKKKNAN